MSGVVAALALGYVVGSFPSAFLVARLKGQDIRGVGSGNMGAMNTARNVGWGLGVLVLLADVGKGTLASALGLVMANVTEAAGLTALIMPLAASVGAVLGHMFSLFVNFKGGKALATTLGVTFPLYPLGGVYTLGLLIALILVTRKVALGAVITGTLYPLVVWVSLVQTGAPQGRVWTTVSSTVVIALFVVGRHVGALGREKQLF